MVKKFEEFIGESVWGDIRRKSLGQESRIEDDINSMDKLQLLDYLHKRYISTVKQDQIISAETLDKIMITICIDSKNSTPYYMIYDGVERGKKRISLPNSFQAVVYSTFKKMKDMYNIIQDRVCIYMSPKDGSEITNKFFIDLVDFLLTDIQKPFIKVLKIRDLNESVWADLRKKSLGQEERLEFDVNSLDRNGLYDYVLDNYGFTEKGSLGAYISKEFFQIPVFFWDSSHLVHLIIKYVPGNDNEIKEIHIDTSVNTCKKLVQKFKEDFIIDDNGGFGLFTLYPQGKKNITNRDYLNIIDIIIQYANNPVIYKKENQ